MPVQPGVEYEGECTGGSWIRSQNGNPGFQIFLKCKDGTASYTIWLAGKDREKAKTRAAKDGAAREELLRYQIQEMEQHEIEFLDLSFGFIDAISQHHVLGIR